MWWVVENRRFSMYRMVPDVRKIQMPTYNGEELLVLFNQTEHYFALHEMTEVSRLSRAFLSYQTSPNLTTNGRKKETVLMLVDPSSLA
ncbi:hypothetical protein Syun_009990 [Stephania yunnanensis]|uniref:Uncharacterized protein n=1 Tax=Stephania yunnanensis TaxID=152371 RepID=A0AAP0KFL4_9MAGN